MIENVCSSSRSKSGMSEMTAAFFAFLCRILEMYILTITFENVLIYKCNSYYRQADEKYR